MKFWGLAIAASLFVIAINSAAIERHLAKIAIALETLSKCQEQTHQEPRP